MPLYKKKEDARIRKQCSNSLYYGVLDHTNSKSHTVSDWKDGTVGL